jgi:hypothetical protein
MCVTASDPTQIGSNKLTYKEIIMIFNPQAVTQSGSNLMVWPIAMFGKSFTQSNKYKYKYCQL